MDRQTEMTKVISAFRNFASAPKMMMMRIIIIIIIIITLIINT